MKKQLYNDGFRLMAKTMVNDIYPRFFNVI